MPHIEIYSKSHCPYCARAKSTLINLGVIFQEIDVTLDRARFEEMLQRSNRRTVPQIFIDDHHVGGADDLEAARSSGVLEQLLAGKPAAA